MWGKISDIIVAIFYGEKFELPISFYYVIGIFLYLFALKIVESATRSLLKMGTSLLSNELARIYSKMEKEIEKLKKFTDSIMRKNS